MQTLAEVNQVLQNIAADHLQINSYGFGSATHFEEALMQDASLFPCMWLELDTFVGDGTQHTRSLNIHITDVNPDQMSAMSVTEQVALDVLAMLRDRNGAASNSETVKAHSMDPLSYRGVDHAHGWQIAVDIEYPFPYDACKAPVEPAECITLFWDTTLQKWNEFRVKWEDAGDCFQKLVWNEAEEKWEETDEFWDK